MPADAASIATEAVEWLGRVAISRSIAKTRDTCFLFIFGLIVILFCMGRSEVLQNCIYNWFTYSLIISLFEILKCHHKAVWESNATYIYKFNHSQLISSLSCYVDFSSNSMSSTGLSLLMWHAKLSSPALQYQKRELQWTQLTSQWVPNLR